MEVSLTLQRSSTVSPTQHIFVEWSYNSVTFKKHIPNLQVVAPCVQDVLHIADVL